MKFPIISICIFLLTFLFGVPFSSSAEDGGRNVFSSALVQQEDSQGGQAGRVIRPAADTSRGMAAKIIERTSVFRGDPKKAFLLSLMVPGLGQWYVKSGKGVRFFAVVEASLWVVMIGHTLSARWAVENYKAFAGDHAMADLAGKNSKYFVDIGNFLDIYDYNHKKLVDGYTELVYPENRVFFWQWDSDNSRSRFRKMRIDADATRNRAVYFGAGIFINHMISAIHATLVARQGKPLEKSAQTSRFYFSMSNFPESNTPMLVASYTRQW